MKRKTRPKLTATRHLSVKPIGSGYEDASSEIGTKMFTCDGLQNKMTQLCVKTAEGANNMTGAFDRVGQMEHSSNIIHGDMENDLDTIIANVMYEEYRSRIESSSSYHMCHIEPQRCQSVHGEHHEICYLNEKILIGYCNEEMYTSAVEYLNMLLKGFEYPPPVIILHLLHFILNSDKIGAIVRTMQVLSHFISTHPPYARGMRQYYIEILTTDCGHEFADMKKSGFLQKVISLLKEVTDDADPRKKLPADTEEEEKRNYYEGLSREQKVLRLTWILELIGHVLEVDFINFHLKHQDDPSKYSSKEISEPLILSILWERASVEGHNECCIMCLIEVWVRANVLQLPLSFQKHLMKIIKVIAEAAFLCDFSLGPYPNYGPHCDTLAQQITHALSGLKAEDVLQVLLGIEPEWLAFRVTYLMTCKQVRWTPSQTITIEKLVNLCYYVLGGTAEEDSNEGEVRSCAVVQDKSRGMSPGTQKEGNELDDTRLKRACSLNDTDSVMKLLRNPDVDASVAESNGWTALHEAVVKGSLQCVRELLNHTTCGKKPVNIHAKNIEGTTPLMCAVMENNLEVAKLLLRYGGVSMLHEKNSRGEAAIQLATSVEMYNLLSDYAGKFSSNVRVSHLAICLAKQLIPFYMDVYRIQDICNAEFQQTVKHSPLVLDLVSFKREIANLKVLKYALQNLPYLVEYEYLISTLSICRDV